eukprot:5619252-Ditylum_brightwellii.AAC.1
MEAWLKAYANELPDKFPTELILKALKLDMKSNMFSFGNTWWLQLIGVTMGTPCACIIAMLYYGLFECHFLLQKYKAWLLEYRHFINNILGIWKTNGDIIASYRAFQSLKEDMNKFGILEWTTQSPSKSVDFLDLIISIGKDRSFNFKTYQKDLNLYLYIPLHSDHPPGVIKNT